MHDRRGFSVVFNTAIRAKGCFLERSCQQGCSKVRAWYNRWKGLIIVSERALQCGVILIRAPLPGVAKLVHCPGEMLWWRFIIDDPGPLKCVHIRQNCPYAGLIKGTVHHTILSSFTQICETPWLWTSPLNPADTALYEQIEDIFQKSYGFLKKSSILGLTLPLYPLGGNCYLRFCIFAICATKKGYFLWAHSFLHRFGLVYDCHIPPR